MADETKIPGTVEEPAPPETAAPEHPDQAVISGMGKDGSAPRW